MSNRIILTKKFQEGFSLLELVIAIAILGIIGTTILVTLYGSTNAVILSDQRTTAESLARSQVEWIKNQGFANDGEYTLTPDIPGGFYIYPDPVVAENVTGKPGLQKISFTVRCDTKDGLIKDILTMEAYKGIR
jgi:prepilin-type N-terminal cleavage/methylation domain-containing protein